VNGSQDEALRERLIHALRGDESHIDFDSAIDDFPAELAGVKLEGAPHTAWQLLEHMRIALHDILEFSRDPKHQSPKWPDGYWPTTEAPADAHAWEASVAAYRELSKAMEAMILDPARDLFQPIEGGSGQTLLREAIVAGSHNSYHLGQLVYLKKALLARS
jgi:hypothetical protein